jgi:phage terminase Nu1 subunit (DNA packaging protein)
MKVKLPSVNAGQFAELCGVTATTVTNWRREGMPCTVRGKTAVTIELAQALPWVLARRDRRPDSQRERVAREQADRLALQNAQSRGELITRGSVSAAIEECFGLLIGELDGLPGRLGMELAAANEPAVISARLRAELMRIRQTAADRIVKFARGSGSTTDIQ